ncbi:MAG TPA: alpha/beta hydrolase [Terriglobales bacterium]|nr:alpha/beta hydrolase [Terriglobales bacterium]
MSKANVLVPDATDQLLSPQPTSGVSTPQILVTNTTAQIGPAVTGQREATGTAKPHEIGSAEAWFAGGERLGYDPRTRAIVGAQGAPLNVFVRREGDLTHAVSFLPGFPDGSFGWAKVSPNLPNAAEMPKLFVEYVGMGDSDKPKDYAYSTAERTDLAEAIWRDFGVQSTTLVAFDFSSLVVLEHLRRRLEHSKQGEPAAGPEIRGVFIFNGGLFTHGHSHPWFTTPILRRLPNRARGGLGGSFSLFKMMVGVMWSKGYKVTDAEVRELHNALGRHDGLFYLAAGAGFVADQKAQGDRLDFGRLFQAYRDQFPFLVGGSDEDPFEHRQVDLAEEQLGKLGLQIERLPGGHLTTHEQPEALARLIARFERGLAPKSRGL